MPHPDMAGMKQKGRVYVCDLAGTEPAGDIVFAKYEKKVFPNGDIEHTYLGPHDDDRKTKELQVRTVCSQFLSQFFSLSLFFMSIVLVSVFFFVFFFGFSSSLLLLFYFRTKPMVIVAD